MRLEKWVLDFDFTACVDRHPTTRATEPNQIQHAGTLACLAWRQMPDGNLGDEEVLTVLSPSLAALAACEPYHDMLVGHIKMLQWVLRRML